MSDPFIDDLRLQVRAFGVFVIYVFGDEEGPGFGYTVGLSALDHPELLMFTDEQQHAHIVLNDLGFRVRDGAARFDRPAILDGLLGSTYEVAVLPVPADDVEEHLGMALEVARDDRVVHAVQLVPTDRRHRWPWEGGSVPGAAQLLLGPVPDVDSLPRVPLAPHVRTFGEGLAHDGQVGLCCHLYEGARPVLLVVRDHQDWWRLLCGESHADDDLRAGSLGQFVDLDPSLVSVLDLGRGQEAKRAGVDGPWTRLDLPRRSLSRRVRDGVARARRRR